MGEKFHESKIPKELMQYFEEVEADPVPCVVCDIFSGSGRALIVAKKLGRKAIGIDLKENYLRMPLDKLAQERLF